MSSNNCDQFCLFQEISGMLIPKKYRAIPLIVWYKQISTIYLPLFFLNWICPHQITNRPFQGHLLKPLQLLQVLNRLPNCSNSSMNTEIVIVDYTSQWQCIESIHYIEVDILIVFVEALLIKIHDLGHLTSLMIATKEKDFFGEIDL